MADRPSLEHIGKLVGASPSTVSRALSGKRPVAPALRERILKTIRETGFTPNAAASAMGRKRHGCAKPVCRTVAMTVFEAPEQRFLVVWEEAYQGLLEAADGLGITVTLCTLRREDVVSRSAPTALLRSVPDGILLTPHSGLDHAFLRKVAPVVAVGGRPTEDCDLPVVEADSPMGVHCLVRHLAGMGHRNMAFLTRDLHHLPFRARAEAFLGEVNALGLHGRVIQMGARKESAVAAEYLDAPSGTRPTAFVASHDGRAVRLLHALAEAGVRVPADVSVVGFDGRSSGETALPPLTTWHVDWRELGRVALSVIKRCVEEGPFSGRTLVGGDLVIRESSGPPPASAGADGNL